MINLTPAGLRAWREAGGYSLPGVAALFQHPVAAITAWENGVEPIPRGVALHVLDHPPGIIQVAWGVAREKLPTDEATRIGYAQRLVQSYIDHMANFPAIFGTDAPSRFCISYWREGARGVPRLYFGDRGICPCQNSERAAWALINQAEQMHILPRTLALLDDCPASIRAFVKSVDEVAAAAPVVATAFGAPTPATEVDFPLTDDLAQGMRYTMERLHYLIMNRRVPYQNLNSMWAGMLYAFSLNYPPDRADIQQWIMAQPYTLGDVGIYAQQLGPYYRQQITTEIKGHMPPGARDVLVVPSAR